MLGSNFIMLDHEVMHQYRDYFMNEVGPMVTSEALGTPKLSDDNFENEQSSGVTSKILNMCIFGTMGEIVCSNNNV